MTQAAATMPRDDGLPPGTLVMLILRVLATQPLHGYAIAQRITQFPTKSSASKRARSTRRCRSCCSRAGSRRAGVSETGRAVREYRLTAGGRKQLELERANYRRVTKAIGAILDTA